MKPRTTLIVVAVLAVLLGYLYWVELPQTPEQMSARLGTPTVTPQPYIYQLDATQVQQIVITDLQFQRAVELTNTSNGWRVTKPLDKPADQNKATATAKALTNLQITRSLNVTDLAPYGLAPASLEARIIMKDGSVYAILLGKTTPDGALYYITSSGERSKVFLIEVSLGLSLQDLLDRPPFELPTPTPISMGTPTAPATLVPSGLVPTLLPTSVTTPKP